MGSRIKTWICLVVVLSCILQIFAKTLNTTNLRKSRSLTGELRVGTCDAATAQVWFTCYPRRCQPTCENAHDVTACPIEAGIVCNEGCYCPDGMLWNGQKCVTRQQCRDCFCHGSGDVHYMSFDSKYFDFQGKCTYVASRVRKCEQVFFYEVLVTNIQCGTGVTCTDAVTILHNDHVIRMIRNTATNDVETTINGVVITTFPLQNSWLIIEKNAQQVIVYIPEIQLEVGFQFWYYFYIKESSILFGNKMEGLCGNCNGDMTDDMQKRDGMLTNIADDFGMSWLVDPLPAGLPAEIGCVVDVTGGCVSGYPPPAGTPDPCKIIRDSSIFGECYDVIDPAPFFANCQFDLCHGGPTMLCAAIKAYASACLNRGICIDWRAAANCPFECPADKVYKPCESGCEVTTQNEWMFQKDPHICTIEKIEGCFCPDNTILQDGKCICPENPVKDCVCGGWGDPHYTNYDQTSFDYQGSCTYVASRPHMIHSGSAYYYDFQVLVTNEPCYRPGKTCTLIVTVLYDGHIIIMQREATSITTTYDGILLTTFPSGSPASIMFESDITNYATVSIPAVHLEVNFKIASGGTFKIRVPSAVYPDNLEGLCGNCNKRTSDDFMTRDGSITSDVNYFGLSWLVEAADIPAGLKYDCRSPKPKDGTDCVINPDVNDPCMKIMDVTLFEECHVLIDPKVYVEACQMDMCNAEPKLSDCHGPEAYAEACRSVGLCLHWRSDDFCPYKCTGDSMYDPCVLGCELTCKNYDVLSKMPELCLIEKREGCKCPDGNIWNGRVCLPYSEVCLV